MIDFLIFCYFLYNNTYSCNTVLHVHSFITPAVLGGAIKYIYYYVATHLYN